MNELYMWEINDKLVVAYLIEDAIKLYRQHSPNMIVKEVRCFCPTKPILVDYNAIIARKEAEK